MFHNNILINITIAECGLDSFSVRDEKNVGKIREGLINDSPWLVSFMLALSIQNLKQYEQII